MVLCANTGSGLRCG